MIYLLEIENFFGFRDRQTIDLRAGKSAEADRSRLSPLFDGRGERVPHVVAFFGANGAGKSTVLKALNFIFNTINTSFQKAPDEPLYFSKFSKRKYWYAPTFFSLSFTQRKPTADSDDAPHDCDYRYELEVDDSIPGVIRRESLMFRPSGRRRFATLFARHGSTINAGKDFDTESFSLVSEVLRPDASLISTLIQLNNPFVRPIQDMARAVSSNISLAKFEGSDATALRQFERSPELLEAFNRDIPRLDIGIERMDIEKNSDGEPVARFFHTGLDLRLPGIFESHGTRQFMRIYPLIGLALRHGGVAIIDELDASIHPLLLPEIVGWFNDSEKNPKGAQLWMTCHTSSLMDHLLKQEVYFCEKDSEGASTIFGLTDIQRVRAIDNFHRKYLGGAYGAVPNIG